MLSSELEVVRVVCRSYFHRTGSNLQIDILICNDRNFSIHQRKDAGLSDILLISRIIRMNNDRCIAKHGLRTRCCNFNKIILTLDRIIDMPEMSGSIFMLYFRITDRSLAFRTPVDDLGAFIDPAFFIKLYKNFKDSIRYAFIHRKALSVPVSGAAKLFKLIYDTSAVFFFPFPGAL